MMFNDAEALGDELRKAREARAITLEKAELATRIRVKFLEALEQGNYAALPTAVQARGFLRNYAHFLGLDADSVIERFDVIQSGGRRRRKVTKPARPVEQSPSSDPRQNITQRASNAYIPPPASGTIPTPRRRNLASMVLIGGVGLLLLAAVGGAGYMGLQALTNQNNRSNILNPLATAATAENQGQATLLPTLDRPTSLPIPAQGSPTVAVVPTTADAASANSGAAGNTGGAATSVALSLQIVERTWLRVIVDDQVQYTGSAAPGTVLQYQGTAIKVRIANAAGVRATVNGQDMGLLGVRGQIVDETFTPGGTIPATAVPGQPPGDNPPATQSGAFDPSATTEQVSNTSPGATFSFTDTPIPPPTRSNVLPTLPPTATFTLTPRPSATPRATLTPSITWTPSPTRTPSLTPTPTVTLTPSFTFTPSITPTVTNTPFILPRETSTPELAEIRHK